MVTELHPVLYRLDSFDGFYNETFKMARDPFHLLLLRNIKMHQGVDISVNSSLK